MEMKGKVRVRGGRGWRELEQVTAWRGAFLKKVGEGSRKLSWTESSRV